MTLNSGTANCSVTAFASARGIAHTMSVAPTTDEYYVRYNLLDGGIVAAGESEGMVVNYINTSNYYVCQHNDDTQGTAHDVYIIKVTGGVGSTLATASNVTITSGDQIECRINYTGSAPVITVTNITSSTQYATATDSSSPLTETRKAGTMCGATPARTGDDCNTTLDFDEITLSEVPLVVAPTVTTDFATPGATTATLNGTKTGGDATVQYGFAYGTNAILTTGVATSALGVLSD